MTPGAVLGLTSHSVRWPGAEACAGPAGVQLLELIRKPQGWRPFSPGGEVSVKGRRLAVRPLDSGGLRDARAAYDSLGLKTMSSAGRSRRQGKGHIVLCTHVPYPWLGTWNTEHEMPARNS